MLSVQVYPNLSALSVAAAERACAWAQAAVQARGRCAVALSGGSTPAALFRLLAERGAPYYAAWPWAQTHVFWGDERCVPPDHAESNYRLAHETLLAHVPVPAEQVHRLRGELAPEEAAQAYTAELRAYFGAACAWPSFDVLWLGLGDDGHTASLFPGTPALTEETRWVVANPVARLNTTRLTLTYPVLNHARYVAFLAAGAAKRAVLHAVLAGEARYPAAGVSPAAGTLEWLVDEAAWKG